MDVRGSKVEMLPLSRKLTATKLTVVAMSSLLVAVNDICRSQIETPHTKHRIGVKCPPHTSAHNGQIKLRKTAKKKKTLCYLLFIVDNSVFDAHPKCI